MCVGWRPSQGRGAAGRESSCRFSHALSCAVSIRSQRSRPAQTGQMSFVGVNTLERSPVRDSCHPHREQECASTSASSSSSRTSESSHSGSRTTTVKPVRLPSGS